MRLSSQTLPDISNTVIAVVSYCAAPTLATLGTLAYVRRSRYSGIIFPRGTAGGLGFQAFDDADSVSVAADWR